MGTPVVSPKDLFWALYLYPGLFLAPIIPAGLMRDGSRWIAPWVVRLSPALRKQFLERIAGYPALADSVSCHDALLRACVTSGCQRALDGLLMLRFPVENVIQSVSIVGLENLERSVNLHRGVMLASGHFLANRLAKRFMKSKGWAVMSVRNLAFRDPRIGRWGKRHLQKRYYDLLHRIIEDEVHVLDPECILKILARLRDGGIVNIHYDATSSRNKHDVPFLGTMRSFPVGYLKVARLAGSPIVPISCRGNSRGLSIEFFPPLSLEDQGESELLKDLVGILEGQILRHPEQWEYILRF